MCGFAGIISNDGAVVTEAELRPMIGRIVHRGPDSLGFYCKNGTGLAHARLSIIDLEGGQQPIHNEDKTIWVVFNGEIFNYIELREELIKRGHQFYTHSDTEVIVHAYEEYGEDFANHLNGQFAIALWIEADRKLLLVRDRVGIAPLFFAQRGSRFYFASEVKAILPALGQAPGLNLQALDQLMTFWSPVSPNTMFNDVYEVSPGQMVSVQGGKISKKIYWDWKFPEDNNYDDRSSDELAADLYDLLVDATKIRLRSDVPVGAYLSGGLDSSTLISIIHRHGNADLKTFSIGFEDKGLDESDYQQQMIRHINADHHQITCSNSDVAQGFMDTIWHTESPILRTAPVPMKILSGLVHSQGYKVVLTGEGADEVLGGYDIFKEAKIRNFWAKNRDSAFRPLLLKRLYPYLDISKSQGLAYVKSFFGVGLDTPNLSYFSHIPRWTTTAKCKEFFSDSAKSMLREDVYNTIEATFPPSLARWHPFNRAQYIESKSLMGGYLLCSQGDRMLLANSVEGRFPFLDHRVIEFANRVHPKQKMKALNEKYLLKKAMRPHLPASIVQRYKQPYRAPDIPAFFSGKTPEYVNELLSTAMIQNAGYFDPRRVEHLLKKIQKGRSIGYKDNMAFVGILSTQIWHHHFVDNYEKNFLN